ncbi:amidohydrolase [Iodidimonas muriae]|uniref:Amidohydrolase n=1 Tax=Iodidimonas muriae TaxID=261467 RepID=A0ABQ2LCP7_9PROT|nr:amidohydrolase [Iodidimonas muriae]GGO10961.1 amidohydrolase [Iodidimonas muriae]
MCRFLTVQAVKTAGLSVALSVAGLQAAQADGLLIYGGPIYTANDAAPMAEAVLVDDGMIRYVGALAEAQAQAEGRTDITRIDLDGAALFPGFTDSHAHLYGIGMREMTLNLEGVASIADLQDRLGKHLKTVPPGALVIGRGWIETHWPEGRFPTRSDLDAVSRDHRIVLVRADGHAAVASSNILAQSGITADSTPPFGGDILKDEAGVPTGMLIDTAMNLVLTGGDQDQSVDRVEVYEKADKVYRSYGWTGLHNMSVLPADVPLLERLSDEGQIALRVYNSIDQEGAEVLMASGPSVSENGRIQTRAVKLYMDGALGSRGAALLEPYADAQTSGLLMMKKAETSAFLEKALRTGIQINTHAIGDKANHMLLDWYKDAFEAVDAADRGVENPRWRIEHAQILDPGDMDRFAEMGVIASMQPSHAIGDLHFAPLRLGQERLVGAYAWKTLLDKGTMIVAGSDAPVERGDPMIEFYAAVGRMDLNGFSAQGWHPEQAVDRMTALKMFTLWPAVASFQEDKIGSITVGKRADFSAFSKDIMRVPVADIPQTHAVLTIIDGEVVYRAGM